MNNENDIEFAFCWFDKDQWQLLEKIDPEGVDDSYEEWRKNANSAISEFEKRGQKIIKVSIKISALQNWCQENGLQPNSKSRSQFAAMLAQIRNENNKT
ncbi:MAG: hypothetical protein OEX12_04080 [Gammaproteobacteria bacterium]|nr:hypothetical protein [Gammaproteobacteria bacterium]